MSPVLYLRSSQSNTLLYLAIAISINYRILSALLRDIICTLLANLKFELSHRPSMNLPFLICNETKANRPKPPISASCA